MISIHTVNTNAKMFLSRRRSADYGVHVHRANATTWPDRVVKVQRVWKSNTVDGVVVGRF